MPASDCSNFNWIVRTIDFSNIIEANDNPLFKVKILIKGATSSLGNNRFDNFKLIGNDKFLDVKINALKNSFILYPNPAPNFVNVKFEISNFSGAELEVFTILGESVFKDRIKDISKASTYIINTQHFSDGIYIIKVKTNTDIISKKFIVGR